MSLSFICMDALIASCMYPSISSLANYQLNNVFLVPKMITNKIIRSPHTIKKTLKFIDSLPYSKNINFDTKTFLSETWQEDITFPYAVARCGNISCWLGTLFVQACRILRLLIAETNLTLHNNFLCFYIHVHAFLAHLSTKCSVSFCDPSMSGVRRPSSVRASVRACVRQQFL